MKAALPLSKKVVTLFTLTLATIGRGNECIFLSLYAAYFLILKMLTINQP